VKLEFIPELPGVDDSRIAIPEQISFLWPPLGSRPLINATPLEETLEAGRCRVALEKLVKDFAVSRIGKLSVSWRQEPYWQRERDYENKSDLSWLVARAVVYMDPLIFPAVERVEG